MSNAAYMKAYWAVPENRERKRTLNRQYYAEGTAGRIKRAAYRAANKARASVTEYWRHLKKKYGLTQEDYSAMLGRQNGVCAACGMPMDIRIGSKPRGVQYNDCVVDHNHDTGEVRGLIHQGCNIAVGAAGESPDRLRRLAEYLERKV